MKTQHFIVFWLTFMLGSERQKRKKNAKTLCFYSQNYFFFRFFRLLPSMKVDQKVIKRCVFTVKTKHFSVFPAFSTFPKENLGVGDLAGRLAGWLAGWIALLAAWLAL